MKHWLQKVLSHLTSPFDRLSPLFLSLFILSSSADLIYWISYGNVKFGIYMALHGLLMCYGLMIGISCLTGWACKIISLMLSLLGVINLCIDVGIHEITHYGFTQDIVAIFMGTNGAETQEFIAMYINQHMMLIVLGLLTCAIILYAIINKYLIPTHKIFQYVGVIFMAIAAIIIFGRNSQNWSGVFLMKLHTIASYQKAPDLRSYNKPYDVSRTNSPHEIVLIIGESLNKDHMSLYGYPHKTTPKLDSLNAHEQLFVFDSIRSSATHTVQAFKLIMSSMCLSDNTDEWSSHDFMLNLLKSAGVHTMWISNQAKAGIHDNIVTRFAELADSMQFCGTQFMGPGKRDLDDVVLPYIRARASDSLYTTKFTLVHLMGSHERFDARYPATYQHFYESDYVEFPKHQRQSRSEYDNSVLYNDWIIYNIINCYRDKEAIILYFPDHALDIYHSDDNYVGHARQTIPASYEAGTNIPFIIWCSELFKKSFPEIVERIALSTKKQYKTENMMYTILDIAGVSFETDYSTENRSLFSTN